VKIIIKNRKKVDNCKGDENILLRNKRNQEERG
jgi:hypothetical protein